MRVVLKEEAAFDAVNGIALLQQELREIGAVLAGDPSDEGDGASMQGIVQRSGKSIIS